ncbi:MAG: putative ribosomal protein L24.e.A, cytosolic, partial [Piptocephalis tieghemiana]
VRLEICSFSGYKIYPGHGKTYVRLDSRTYKFISSKTASLFLQGKNPRKIHWTVVFRRMHKKGIAEETTKKRTRRTVKHQRAIVGASVDQIRARRTQKPEVREAQRKKAAEEAKAKKAQQKADKAK